MLWALKKAWHLQVQGTASSHSHSVGLRQGKPLIHHKSLYRLCVYFDHASTMELSVDDSTSHQNVNHLQPKAILLLITSK